MYAPGVMEDANQSSMDTLFEVKEEVVKVKKVIDQKGSYLSMTGEMLINHFQQLRKKEKYLESIYKDNLRPVSPKASMEDPRLPELDAESGYNPSAGIADAPVAGELPSGIPDQFNENDASEICAHLSKYEASASESAKALKALASLAYKKPRESGCASGVVTQVLRLLALHPSNNLVMLNGTKALHNIAYDQAMAVAYLSPRDVFHALIEALRNAAPGEVRHKCSGAIANIVKADVAAGGADGVAGTGQFSSRSLFTLAVGGTVDLSHGAVVVELVREMIENNVAPPDFFAKCFIEASQACEESNLGAEHWLNIASMFGKNGNLFANRQASDVIAAVSRVMSSQVPNAQIQVACMTAFTDLIGTDVQVLGAFAQVKGIELIDRAMMAHPKDATLQTQGIKCLAGGVQWTQELQEQAGFSVARAIELTKAAMAEHRDVFELQVAAAEALYRYLTSPGVSTGSSLAALYSAREAALKSNGGLEVLRDSLEFLQPTNGQNGVHSALSQYLVKASAVEVAAAESPEQAP